MGVPRLRGSLRRKLIALLAAFGAFAVATAAGTIYGTQWYLDRAVRDFEDAVGRSSQADRLAVTLRQQTLLLRILADDAQASVRPYFSARDEFQTLLRQSTDLATEESQEAPWSRLIQLSDQFHEECDRCLVAIDDGRSADARTLLANPIESQLLPELESRLVELRSRLDHRLSSSSRALATGSRRVVAMTVAVAALAAALVVAGMILLRRWLLRPIQELQRAAERFGAGDLTARVTVSGDDELGALGQSMNEMAGSVARAQGELLASETKHRLLFQNLRDAVVLVDESGSVAEYHDSDDGLLGLEASQHVGRRLLDVWPQWRETGCDWDAVLRAAILEGRRYRAMGIELPSAAGGRPASIVDLLVYRVEFGGTRHAAIVLRDVSDRSDLQKRLRQAETMEAVGSLAGGLAHDFNNLLAGVIGNLSLLEGELSDETQAERVRTAIRTCWQASGLSRRLLNFAGSAHGQPQVFCLRDAVGTILSSLDPSFLEGIELLTELEQSATVRMDRDQLTQSVLNLVRNAREAMSDGGRLSVKVERVTTRRPDGGRADEWFGVLVISDTGCGMSREVQARVYEPFFTTKSRASHRGRGMGMAIVYAAVRNAGGFIRIESEPQRGTTFRIHLPICESLTSTSDIAATVGPGAILVLESDPVVRTPPQTA